MYVAQISPTVCKISIAVNCCTDLNTTVCMYTVHKVYLALAMLVLTIMSGGTSVTLESLRGKYNETAPLENCARAGTETMKEATRLMVEVRYLPVGCVTMCMVEIATPRQFTLAN